MPTTNASYNVTALFLAESLVISRVKIKKDAHCPKLVGYIVKFGKQVHWRGSSDEPGGPQKCAGCGKFAKTHIEFTKEAQEAWEIVLAGMADTDDDDAIWKKKLPAIIPPCSDSYAELGYHSSKTTQGVFNDYSQRIRTQIAKTLEGCSANLPDAIQQTTAKNAYILQYWVNWVDEDEVRTVEVKTRLYSPIGNGKSVDLFWRRHFRQGMSVNGELESYLRYQERHECHPLNPSQPGG